MTEITPKKAYKVWSDSRKSELSRRYSSDCVNDAEILFYEWCVLKNIESFKFSDAKVQFMVWSDPRINGVLVLLKDDGKIFIPEGQRNRNITYTVCTQSCYLIPKIANASDSLKDKRKHDNDDNSVENYHNGQYVQRKKFDKSTKASANAIREIINPLQTVNVTAVETKHVAVFSDDAEIAKKLQLYAEEDKSRREAEKYAATKRIKSVSEEEMKAMEEMNKRFEKVRKQIGDLIVKMACGDIVNKTIIIDCLCKECGEDEALVEECLLQLQTSNKIMIDEDTIYLMI